MKRSELFFAAALVPIDFLAIMLAGAAAYGLRTSAYVQRVRPATFVVDLGFLEYMELISIVALVVVGIFAWQGLYAMRATRRLIDEYSRIFAGVSMGVMLVIVFIFLRAELFQSRFIVLAAYMFAILFVALGRWIIRKVQLIYLRRGVGVHRVVLVGNGRFTEQLSQLFARKPHLGYQVVCTLDEVHWDELEDAQRSFGIDEVIKADHKLSTEDNLVLLDFCDKYKITYRYIPDLFETYASNIKFSEIEGIPVMELQRTPLDGWGRIAKRIMDLGGAVLGLILLVPLFFCGGCLHRA